MTQYISAGSAWYESDRASFLHDDLNTVVGQLASAAAEQDLHIESDQREEWISSVGLLQTHLAERVREVEILRETLKSPDFVEYKHVILEYDFRRRGLRIDCVLLGNGIIVVIEFKRSEISASDRDQVTNYCINLVEFHEETRRVCQSDQCIVVPVLALTQGSIKFPLHHSSDFHNPPWSSVLLEPLQCDASCLHKALKKALDVRRGKQVVERKRWMEARFSPSSTIIDAAISLYGQHNVSAIKEHAAPVELIDKCIEEVANFIELSQKEKKSRIIFVSGAPGAGKTLVGLKLAFDPRFRNDAVFVTGNAPLVDVLSEALKKSYRANRGKHAGSTVNVISGYARKDAVKVIAMSTFKIVKAHAFLGERGKETGSCDGKIVIFDEAQRTYEKGREVLRKKLEEDEASLILESLDRSYGPGAVVVALLGHNQAINRGEMGVVAWFKAAKKRGWRYAISDETLALSEVADTGALTKEANRDVLHLGHFPQSLRYYRNRNGEIEQWADKVLSDNPNKASEIASKLAQSGDTIWIVRDLGEAKTWVNSNRIGEQQAGIIASAQARRLSAEGLFVELKPDIAKWILAPSGDIRSSNMLETVQNQYQIQGLEIDYTIVCWDADLRRDGNRWASFKISGAEWQKDKTSTIAKNGYRVLLTRARKGMILFVPKGDLKGADSTRAPKIYNEITDYLLSCGAKPYISHAQ